MTHLKIQAALDEIIRLCDTLKERVVQERRSVLLRNLFLATKACV